MEMLETEILQLDHRGFGVATHKGKKLYVPFTHAQAKVKVQLVDQAKEGYYALPESLPKAACPHFATCGACLLQHLSAEEYSKFKNNQLNDALTKFDINKEIDGTHILPEHVRRRVRFKAQRTKKKGVQLGFYAVRSHKLVDISSCLVIAPELEKTIAFWKDFLERYLLIGDRVDVQLTLCANGIDAYIVFEDENWQGSLGFLNESEAQKQLKELNIIRLNVGTEKQVWARYQEKEPYVIFGGVEVLMSPKGFLQASVQADEVLTQLMLDILKPDEPMHKVADLFSGRGTFTLPLVKMGLKVDAYECDDLANKALKEAASRFGLDVVVKEQQLFKNPVKPDVLNQYDAVVIDPPRAGADAQVKEIAKAHVGRVVYVSCNPQSFARDAKTLINAGYRLEHLYAVDQFMYSAHVEVVAGFISDV